MQTKDSEGGGAVTPIHKTEQFKAVIKKIKEGQTPVVSDPIDHAPVQFNAPVTVPGVSYSDYADRHPKSESKDYLERVVRADVTKQYSTMQAPMVLLHMTTPQHWKGSLEPCSPLWRRRWMELPSRILKEWRG